MKKKKAKQSISLLAIAMMLFQLFVLPMNTLAAPVEDEVTSPVMNEDGSVTFQFQDDSVTGDVYLRGEMTDWEGKLMQEEGGVHSYTVDELTPVMNEENKPKYTQEYQFFYNDGQDHYVKDPANPLENADNSLVYLGEVLQSPEVTNDDVTFRFKGLGNESTVQLAGSFTSWGENPVELTKDPDSGVWSTTVENLSTGDHFYKFIVDGQWMVDYSNPETNSEGNSVFAIPSQDGSVDEQAVDSPIVSKDGEVTFQYKNDEIAGPVYVRGTVTDWDSGEEMTQSEDGTWTLTKQVPAGVYQYKYFYGEDTWITDPGNDKQADGNSQLIVPGLITDLPAEVEKGGSIDLTAELLGEDGQLQAVEPTWSLKESVEGVSLTDGTVTVSADSQPDSTFTVVADYQGENIEHTFTILDKLYTFTVNYFRYDGEQMNWDLWMWEDGKDGIAKPFTTQNGEFAQAVIEVPSEKINTITRPGSWDTQGPERSIEIQEGDSVEAWIVSGDENVYYSEDEVNTDDSIQAAYMDAEDEILVTTTAEVTSLDSFTLHDATADKELAVKGTEINENQVKLVVENPSEVDVTNVLNVSSSQFPEKKVTMRNILNNQEYVYSGDDLGLTYSAEASTFKLWAPTAEKVSVALYDEAGSYNENGVVTDHSGGDESAMTNSSNGVWELTVDGDLSDQYYMYKIEFADGTTNYVVDPYARAVSANGQRTAIVSLDSTDPVNWEPEQKPALDSPTDSVIYEMHVRDFSIDEQAPFDNKGKYLAFTEEGLTDEAGNTIGVDHLEELGVNQVHLLPVYDYKTVNELAPEEEEFNWGYDPQNYNVPEGSYATDPETPSNRLTEFKQMVQALHDNDIRVIMDVVYNHTYEVPNGPFDKIVPGYYYRTTDDGKLANGSGVGNEIATERPMVRKFVKDSVRYWAEEYNVDGFRFDLMGLIDTKTMTELTEELHQEVDPSILVYGEPWQAGGSVLPGDQQTLKGSQKDKGFAVFNDNLRNAIKGGSDDASTGFATGSDGQESGVVTGVKGAIDEFTSDPTETINYVTAHDNLNLWDKIIKTQGLEEQEGFVDILNGELQGESAENYDSVEAAVEAATPHHNVESSDVLANETVKRSLLANGIVMTAQGIPFIHEGAEFLRTKFGDHNSYKSPDAINKMRWSYKDTFRPVFDYYEGLIDLRQSHPAFRMDTREAVEEHFTVLQQENNVVAYQLSENANFDTWKNIVVVYNANDSKQTVTLPSDQDWNVVVDAENAGTETLETVSGNQVEVDGLSMMVLYDEANEYTPEATSIDVTPEKVGLAPGSVRTIQAVVRGQNGRPMSDVSVEYASSDEAVAKVTGNKVEALSKGTAVITVTVGDLTATMDVTVADLVPSAIALSGDDSIYETRTTPLDAVVMDQFEQKLSDPDITWTSSDDSVASVDSNGNVTGNQPGTAVITAKAGDVTATLELEVKKYVKRYVQFEYVRDDQDYTDWNIWTWQTGMAGGDGEKLFEDVDGRAISTFEVGPETTKVGFVLRKGHDWDTATKDPIGSDRYIELDPNQAYTKVVVTSGVEEIHTVPTIEGPVLENGDLTFYYRDEELYRQNKMDEIDSVQVKVNGQTYDMTYVAKDERFTIQLKDIDEGTYEYSFLVKKDGETTEVLDPYNQSDGKSTIEYSIPEVAIKASVAPNAISSQENAVLEVAVSSEEEVSYQDIFVDLTPLGGKEKVSINQELMAQTIAVDDSISPGKKTLTITVIDEYGNQHEQNVNVQVKGKPSKDFDWDESRIYFLLTDRFNNGDPSNDDPNGVGYDTSHPETYHGGDFQGITDKLDYLKDLGINTIWMSPIVDNIDWDLRHDKEGHQYGYHGYWADDFTTLEDHFGDMEAFKTLIDEAHERDMKIMVDVVLNHAGYGLKSDDPSIGEGIANFPTDEDRAVFEGMFRDGGTDTIKGELSGLPDFKTEDPAVRQQIIDWQTDWLEKARTDKGNTIDYFRVDTVKHVEDATWKAFKNQLTEIAPEFKMIGEHFGASVDNQGGYLNTGQMDSLLDFEFKHQAANLINGNISSVEEYLEKRNGQLDNAATLGQFLSSHDEDGFLVTSAGGDRDKMKVAASLQITAKGQPVIYYGEEIGQSGMTAGDMDAGEFNENRDDFAWDQVEGNDLYNHYKTMLNIRADYSDVFSKGNRTEIVSNDDEDYLFFQRSYEGEDVVVGMNTTDEAKSLKVSVPFETGAEVVDVYSGAEYAVDSNQKIAVELPARSDGGTMVLAASDEPKEKPKDRDNDRNDRDRDEDKKKEDKEKDLKRPTKHKNVAPGQAMKVEFENGLSLKEAVKAKSSNESIAKINENGELETEGEGIVIVQAEDKNGKLHKQLVVVSDGDVNDWQDTPRTRDNKKEWNIEFNTPMNKDKMDERFIQVINEDGEVVEVDVEFEDEYNLVVNPADSYEDGTYYLYISNNLTSDGRRKMKEAIVMSFTVR